MNEVGDKRDEAACYGNLGAVLQSLGSYAEAKEFHIRALAINRKIGNLTGEGKDCGNLGNVFITNLASLANQECCKKQEMRLIFKYGTVGPSSHNQGFSFT